MRRAAYDAGLILEEFSSWSWSRRRPASPGQKCCARGRPHLHRARLRRRHRGHNDEPRCTKDTRPADELRVPSGGQWGSTFIDSDFEAFVEKLLGSDVFRRFEPFPVDPLQRPLFKFCTELD